MSFRRLFVLSIVCAVFFSVEAEAQNPVCAGIFSSPKGFGLCLDLQKDTLYFESASLLIDMYGIYGGNHSVPGVKANYNFNWIFAGHRGEECTVDFYAGPGVTLGYVRDRDYKMGAIAGLCGIVGTKLVFDVPWIISIEFQADLAFGLNKNNRYNTVNLALYEAGYSRLYYPQIRIQHFF